MSVGFNKTGDLDSALSIYQQSLDSAKQCHDLQEQGNALFSMAQICLTYENHPRAFELFQESLDLFEQTGDLQNRSRALSALAFAHEIHGPYANAIRVGQECLQVQEQLGDFAGQLSSDN